MKEPEGGRDWAAVRASKEAYWRTLGPAERLRLADELRQHALLLHPDWPTSDQRAADYEAHVRLSERLEHAASSASVELLAALAKVLRAAAITGRA